MANITIKRVKGGYNINRSGRKVDFSKTRFGATVKADRIREKLGKKPQIVKRGKRQSKPQNKSHTKSEDKKRLALPPGKRISKSGNVYYEYREDHSDRNKRTRL